MSGITGNVVFSGGCVCWKKNAIARKKRKNIICLTCVGHMMHMKHMKFEKGFFERTAGENAFCRMGYELLPPPAGGPPPSKREVFGEGNWTLAECRRARDARPYNVAGNCNCEMRLQRWVASWQRLDAFATVGCTAVPRRSAHCAPVYLQCYNNLSRGRAKGHRGDCKAPICNRRQGRRP